MALRAVDPSRVILPANDRLGSAEDVATAWQILAAGAPRTARELVRISQEAESEWVRVQAAQIVLASVGLARNEGVNWLERMTPADEVDAALDGPSPAELVRARLALLAPPAPDPDQGPDA